jgi:hypothetical protein
MSLFDQKLSLIRAKIQLAQFSHTFVDLRPVPVSQQSLHLYRDDTISAPRSGLSSKTKQPSDINALLSAN